MTAALAEILLQSHEGELVFLPALPAAWGDGAVEGFCARGGFEVSFRWKVGRLERATLLSKNGNICRIRTDRIIELSSEGMKPITLRPKKGVVRFETRFNRKHELSFHN